MGLKLKNENMAEPKIEKRIKKEEAKQKRKRFINVSAAFRFAAHA